MKLAIWGLGSCSSNYMKRISPDHTVVAIVDNNAAMHGSTFYGLLVRHPRELPAIEYDYLIVASAYFADILAQVLSQGLAPPEKVLSVQHTPVRASRFTTSQHRSCACPDDILARMDDRSWFHAIEIRPGCLTPGHVLPNPAYLDYPELQNLTGKRVLDIGAFDGGYTFMAESRGGEVTAYDIQDPDHSGFNIAKDLLGSRAEHLLGSVYDLRRERHGVFDVVMYFGVFYHLFDPLRAFCNINSVLDEGGLLLFEGAVLDHAYNIDAAWRDKKDVMGAYTCIPLAYYTSKTYWMNDWSTWFVPNMLCLKEWLVSAGFEVLSTNVDEQMSRGYGLARKVAPPMLQHEVINEPLPRPDLTP